MKKKVLITGGAGYVGSALTNYLIDNWYDVVIFDRGYFGFEHINEQAELIEGDIRKPPKDLLKGIDTVVHLAAFSNDPTADYDPKANWTMNFEGTKAMVDLAKKSGVKRFIEASTCSMYYQTGKRPKEEFNELSELNCQAPYPKSKKAAEDYLMEQEDDKFKPISLRKGTIYGLSPKMRYDLVLNTFVKDAYTKGEIKLHAGGELFRPILSLTEAIDTYKKMIEEPIEKVGGEIFNVVGQNIKIKDLAFIVYKTILEKRNKAIKLDIWRYKDGVIRSYKVNSDKLNNYIPERNKQAIEEAILEIWDDLVLSYDPEDPIYYNIKNLETLSKYEKRLNDLGTVL